MKIIFLFRIKCLVDVDKRDLGLRLVDGEDVQLFVLLDGLVDRIRLEALARAPEICFGFQN